MATGEFAGGGGGRQAVPIGQLLPHAPQLLESAERSVQDPAHSAVPAGHMQTLFWQILSPVQTFPAQLTVTLSATQADS
jgi:hypothetical protein